MAQKLFYEAYGGTAPENYERYFVPCIGRPFAEDLIDAAAIQPGERVLDVACGTGVIVRLAAERVGASGSVDGLDMNPGMLEVARSVAPSGTSITWHQCSAESMPLADGSYDIVTCQLGLQFMADKPAALSEMHRVLVPGGRLVLSVAGPTPPPFIVFAEALGQHINPGVVPFVHMVFSLNDPDELRGLLADAGFQDASVQTYTRKLRLPPPRDFMWQYIHSTPLADAVAQAGEASQTALEHDVVNGWQAFVEDGAMTFTVRGLLAMGRK
jgi:ubiquinone/menaquinone biosynthesis C-methylase UbiE